MRFPWLVQGVTDQRGPEDSQSWNFATVTETGAARLARVWVDLTSHLDFRAVTYARQVHGITVLIHEGSAPGWRTGPSEPSPFSPGSGSPPPGVGCDLPPEADGHLTREPGLLLGVSLGDCVPVFLVEPSSEVVGVLHAGWRGVSAGVLEEGIGLLRDRFAIPAEDIHFHLGPSICGRCYEVGPEVHGAVGLRAPEAPGPLDLRAVLVDRALEMGLKASLITRSSLCTLCGESPFFSHRATAPTGSPLAL